MGAFKIDWASKASVDDIHIDFDQLYPFFTFYVDMIFMMFQKLICPIKPAWHIERLEPI